MSSIFTGVFNGADKLAMRSLDLRSTNGKVITSNIANAETPGYRAIGYDFEEQLQAVANVSDEMPMKTSMAQHMRHPFATADGQIQPDVFIRPTESIGHDSNTVDLDEEMAQMAKNDILFRTAVEAINRKVAILRYAIAAGGR